MRAQPSSQQAGPAAQPPAGERGASALAQLVRQIATRFDLGEGLPFWLSDPAGRILHASAEFVALQRQAAEDGAAGLRGLPAADEIARQLQQGRRPAAEVTVGSGAALRRFRCHHLAIRDTDGALAGVAAFYVEVTAQAAALDTALAAHDRLADFLRASTDWLWETDEEDRLVSISDRLTGLAGQPRQQFLHRRLTDLGRFPAADAGENPLLAMAERRPFRERLFEIAHEQGVTRQFHLSGVPVFAPESGAFRGYRGVASDVTLRLVAERDAREAQHRLGDALARLHGQYAEIEDARAEAEAALAAKQDFLATMSHELRTPLNAIIGFSDVMRLGVFGPLAPRYAAYANDIVQAGRHLLSLIDDMFDVARVENDTLALDIQPVDAGVLVEEVAAMLRLRAEHEGIDIAGVHLPPGRLVRADAMRLKQILVNLLTNAVKFSPAGSRVGIEAAETISPAGTPMLALTVWDTGPGIPEDMQQRIFEKFHQGGSVYAPGRGRSGLGLGLFLSRHFAESMGGTITVRSQPHQGARFTVTLPRAMAAEPVAPAAQP